MSLFTETAPEVMDRLIETYGLTDYQAAAVLGNIGHESFGLTELHQIHGPAVGWAQWEGDRKKAYLKWCANNGLSQDCREANEEYLFLELSADHHDAIHALKACSTLDSAVVAFERAYERAGVKAYPSRKRWARLALDAYRKGKGNG